MDRGLKFCDFPPQITKNGDNFDSEPFSVLVGRANSWLSQSQGIELINCQTFNLKFSSSQGLEALDPTKTQFDPMTGARMHWKHKFLHGLRLYYKETGSSDPVNLVCLSFAPKPVSHEKDKPVFPLINEEYKRISDEVKGQGCILNVETVEVKNKFFTKKWDGNVDLEQTFFVEDHPATIMQITRVYFTTNKTSSETIGAVDFAPTMTHQGIFSPDYAPLDEAVAKANAWIRDNNRDKRIVGVQILDSKHNRGKPLRTDGFYFHKLDTMWIARYVRVHYAMGGEPDDDPITELCLKTLLPAVRPGEERRCCRVTQAASTVEQSAYLDKWARLSGASIVGAQRTFMGEFEFYSSRKSQAELLSRSCHSGEWDLGGHKRGPMPHMLVYVTRIFTRRRFHDPAPQMLDHNDVRFSACACDCTIL